MCTTLARGVAVDPFRLSEADLRAALTDTLRSVDRLQAYAARLLVEVEDRGLTDVDGRGAPRPATYVREAAAAAMGRTEANRVARRARARRVLPLLAALHDSGEVSTAFLDAAAGGLGLLPADAWPCLDEVLAGEAKVLEPSKVPAVIAQARVMTDSDAANDRAEKFDGLSRVYLSPVGSDGGYALNGMLYGAEAERAHAVLNTYGQQADSTMKPGPEQRALGLFQIIRIAERALGDPEFRNPPRGADTHLVVFATAAAAAGEPGAPAPTTAAGQTVDPGLLGAVQCCTRPDILISEPATSTAATTATTTTTAASPTTTTATATTIPLSTSPATAGSGPVTDGELLRRAIAGLVSAPAGYRLEPLAYGRHKRTATAALYIALVARDWGCVNPWCDRPPSWTQAHHLLEFEADDGPTDIDAMALVCFPHHAQMHRRGEHLHPPWCECQPCRSNPSLRWRLRRTVPIITTRAGVLRYQSASKTPAFQS